MNPYKQYDSGDMFNVLKSYYKQVQVILDKKLEIDKTNYSKIEKIIVSGLGGSAISGDVAYTLFQDQLSIPFFVNRNYNLPNFADNKTLVIACSYSGNTEETLSSFDEAISKKCEVVVISSGGKLKEKALAKNLLFLEVDGGFQPRCAIGLMLTTLIKFLETSGFIFFDNGFYENVINLLKEKSETYSTENGAPYEFATKLLGKFPVIHSTELLQSINVRFRSQLAENSKVLSYSSIIPELNHNEIIAWEKFDEKFLPAILIQMIDEKDHPRNKLRFDITRNILNEVKVEILRLQSNEPKFYLRVFDLIYFVDWVSFFLAVIRKVDPTPIKNINALKEALSKIN
ncbi:MAG: bifunctional phosphoglucose/phosphomannose isomerase [Ignavibacteria bacterium]